MIRFLGEFVEHEIAQACRLSCTVASLGLPSLKPIAISLKESVASMEKMTGWQFWSVGVLHRLSYINAGVAHIYCKKADPHDTVVR